MGGEWNYLNGYNTSVPNEPSQRSLGRLPCKSPHDVRLEHRFPYEFSPIFETVSQASYHAGTESGTFLITDPGRKI